MMDELKINLENCYGIGKLDETISFSDSVAAVIYAPNGSMKTSLTKTMKSLIEGKTPKDEFYSARVSTADVKIDRNDISSENLYIFSNTDADTSKRVSKFLADSTLKAQYDAIVGELDDFKKELNKDIKSVSHSSDCEKEIVSAFSSAPEDTIFDCYLRVANILEQENKQYPVYDFKFNDVFDTGEKVKVFLNTNKDDIVDYFNRYESLLVGSRLFSSGEESFGTYQVDSLIKAVSDNRFFKAEHKMVLKGGNELSTSQALQDIVTQEKEKLFEDEKLKKIFDKIDSKLQGNENLRKFKEVIHQCPELIPQLVDYDTCIRNILLGYIQKSSESFNAFVGKYYEKKDELKQIIERASLQQQKWQEIIDLFNSRFYVPFQVEINNVSEVLLHEKTAQLKFTYKDGQDAPVQQEKSSLMQNLSLGEQHALNILQNLFEIEARKTEGKETLLVFDDVADSFDYRNKYAIVEYLNDIKDYGIFKLLILTHNFDFYRTVVSRLDVKEHYFVSRDDDRRISFHVGTHNPDILKNRFISRINEAKSFIGLIPFARNIIEYTDGADAPDYALLTSCLHYKDDTNNIKCSQLYDVFKNRINSIGAKVIDFGEKKYYVLLMESAEDLANGNFNDVDLPSKLVLSIAIRLLADKYMKSVLTSDQLAGAKLSKNQTGVLFERMKQYYSGSHPDTIRLLNKAFMYTSETIHLNNFMFEPLVDVSMIQLIDLYKQVKTL